MASVVEGKIREGGEAVKREDEPSTCTSEEQQWFTEIWSRCEKEKDYIEREEQEQPSDTPEEEQGKNFLKAQPVEQLDIRTKYATANGDAKVQLKGQVEESLKYGRMNIKVSKGRNPYDGDRRRIVDLKEVRFEEGGDVVMWMALFEVEDEFKVGVRYHMEVALKGTTNSCDLKSDCSIFRHDKDCTKARTEGQTKIEELRDEVKRFIRESGDGRHKVTSITLTGHSLGGLRAAQVAIEVMTTVHENAGAHWGVTFLIEQGIDGLGDFCEKFGKMYLFDPPGTGLLSSEDDEDIIFEGCKRGAFTASYCLTAISHRATPHNGLPIHIFKEGPVEDRSFWQIIKDGPDKARDYIMGHYLAKIVEGIEVFMQEIDQEITPQS